MKIIELIKSARWSFIVVIVIAGALEACGGGSDSTNSQTQGEITAAAHFNNPTNVAVDSQGNVYVSDSLDSTVKKITPAGVVKILAGASGAFGHVDGQGSAARFEILQGITVDSQGNVFVCDQHSMIRKISPEGMVTTLAGMPGQNGVADGTGSMARFESLNDITVDSNDNLYAADGHGAGYIRKINQLGSVTTLAGGGVGDVDGQGSLAGFNQPSAITIDVSGNLYVTDSGLGDVRKVTPAGLVTTVYSPPRSGVRPIYTPSGIAVDSNNIYVANGGSTGTIVKINSAGLVSTFVGTSGVVGKVDGVGAAAQFSNLGGLAIDNLGNIYVADSGNNLIRKVTSAGTVTTLAGN